MDFLNSLQIRITLAVMGGIFYAFLTYLIVNLLDLPSALATLAAVFVYILYLGSRFLLLFSGIDTPYYSKRRKGIPKTPPEKNSFYDTAQWVGKFYHQHDLVLFIFLGILSIFFLITLAMDGLEGQPFGNTIQNLWNPLSPLLSLQPLSLG